MSFGGHWIGRFRIPLEGLSWVVEGSGVVIGRFRSYVKGLSRVTEAEEDLEGSKVFLEGLRKVPLQSSPQERYSWVRLFGGCQS